MAGRARVYIACSLDGFIAGPDDDLSWLPEPSGDPAPDYGHAAFMAEVGALLMGRNTFEVVAGFMAEGGEWPYGERPVLVATGRELDSAHARAVSGPIAELIAEGLRAAGGRDLYVDGGAVIRQALDAGLIAELIVTLVPTILGAGSPLFAGVERRHSLTLRSHESFEDGMVQLRYSV